MNLTHAMQRLSAAGCDTPALDARLLMAHALGCTQEEVLMRDEPLLPAQEKVFEALLTRREAREPMSHILGEREFYGRMFCVTKDVLTPRADSETLIDAVLARVPDRGAPLRILDLGTGSGCLLSTLLAELPHATGTGVDTSAEALAVARENAEKTAVGARAEWVASHWLNDIKGVYQIVVANPPYIASNAIPNLMPEVVQFEPLQALDGGPDGLGCYRDIAGALPHHVTDGAIVALEVGAGQHTAVAEIFTAAGFAFEAFAQDLAGIARIVLMRRATHTN